MDSCGATATERGMDTHHLHWMLERIRENQLLQSEAERRNAERLKLIIRLLKEPKSAPPLPTVRKKLGLTLVKEAVSAFAQYAASLLTLAYILRGGDLMTALEKLLGLAKAL